MARSLNLVLLIGNLTRDPELRYTANGRAVCDIGLATNRTWKTEAGEKKEETEFHRIVIWGKLAEISGQYLKKGRKVYVRGRLTNRSFTGKDGTQKNSTEIIADDLIFLSGTQGTSLPGGAPEQPEDQAVPQKTEDAAGTKAADEADVNPEEIPF
jgi:single-strand DNA-binding protein